MVKLLSKVFGRSTPSKGSSLPRPSSADCSEVSDSSVGYVGERNSGGARHGWGRFLFASGDSYEGEWNDNMKWGYGDAHYCSGSRYRGHWRADMKHGQGIFVFGHDGSSYTGDWVDDKKTGNGVAVFRTGNRYAGQWLADAMHGKGRFVYASGDAYEGDWGRNRKTGFGTWTSADGTCTYAGAWQDDLRHGAGVLVGADGVVCEVEYRNGDLVTKVVPRRPLPRPTAVDCSIPEPPSIIADPRATSAPLRVPRARGARAPPTPPSSSNPRTPFPLSPVSDIYDTTPTPEEEDDDIHGLRTGSRAAAGAMRGGVDVNAADHGRSEEALLDRLRAWRRNAPAPPLPDTPPTMSLPKELVGREHGPAPNSAWGTRSSSSESGAVETVEVDAQTVCRHADLSLGDCDDTFTASMTRKADVSAGRGRSQSLLSGGSALMMEDVGDDMMV